MRNVWKLRVEMVSTLLPGLEQSEAPKRIIKIEPNVNIELSTSQAITALGIDNLHRIREATFPSMLDLSDSRLQLQSDKFLAFVPDEYKEYVPLWLPDLYMSSFLPQRHCGVLVVFCNPPG